MDRSPFRTAGSRGIARPWVQGAGGWVWRAVVVTCVLGVAGALATYLAAPAGWVLQPWIAWLIGCGLVIASSFVAVRLDVASARRARGRRGADVLAVVVAAVLVGVWFSLLWTLSAAECFASECQPPTSWARYFVLVPVVPLAGLALIGFLVRRTTRD